MTTILLFLAEDTGLWNRRQKMLLLIAIADYQDPWVPPWAGKVPGRWDLHTRWFVLQERKTELREPETFIMGRYHAYLFTWRESLYFPSMFAIQQPWKFKPEQKYQCLRLQDGQKCERPMEHCLPNTTQRLDNNSVLLQRIKAKCSDIFALWIVHSELHLNSRQPFPEQEVIITRER